MFRGKPDAFRQDSLALALAQEALRFGKINNLSTEERAFLYMPFMHSESLPIHEKDNGIIPRRRNGRLSEI